MKGCARSCLIGLAGWLFAFGAIHYWLRGFGPARDILWLASIGAAFLATMSIGYLWSIRGVLRERALLRDAVAGQPPEDGQWVGLSGVIRSSSPLTSPISGTTAVAYKYDVYEMRRVGKSTQKVTHYEGTALATSTISTNLGSFRLLSVPIFDMPDSDVDHEIAIRNATVYIASTEFETSATAKEDRQTLSKEWTDDDGVFRRDKKGTDDCDLSLCRFDEQIIAQGEQVCVLGRYSQMRGGIIPDPNWSKQTRVIRGDGEAGVQQLGSRAVRYFIGAVITAAIAAGICWAYINSAIS